jgi:long-chain-fatty-acid--CoA ligase ACSBG
VPLVSGATVYFARPDALSGSIVQTLNFAKPTLFFAVPRVYEKFESKIRETFDKAGFIKKKISNYIYFIKYQLRIVKKLEQKL